MIQLIKKKQRKEKLGLKERIRRLFFEWSISDIFTWGMVAGLLLAILVVGLVDYKKDSEMRDYWCENDMNLLIIKSGIFCVNETTVDVIHWNKRYINRVENFVFITDFYKEGAIVTSANSETSRRYDL